MASTAEKLDLELWEEAKADARDAYGGHSARAMQYASKLYKARGGRYKGRKRADNRLVQWTRQDWTTKSGRPSRETGERYLPRAAIESLSPAEYGATSRAKRAGGGVGSVVAQPQSIREKTRKFRKVNPDMATAKQIAARKRFAEMARSGELAQLRKKATKRNPAKTVSEEISRQVRKGKPQKQAVAIALEMERAGNLKKNPNTRWRVPEGDDKYIFDPYGIKGLTVVAEKTIKEDGYAPVDLSIIYNEPKGVYQYAHGGVIEKEHTPSDVTAKRLAALWYEMNKEDFRAARRNPTATRAPARPRTKLISNGREKNPASRDVFFVNVIDDGGFIYGMDDRTPVTFRFSNRELTRGIYRSFALPYAVTSNPAFQAYAKSLPQGLTVMSLAQLKTKLRDFA